MTNVHILKEKKKNINRELGKLYTEKRNLSTKIEEMEKAKLNNKVLIDINREKTKKVKVK